jgi:hypothetical protein
MPDPLQELQTSLDVPEPLQPIHFLSFASAEINEDIPKLNTIRSVRANAFDFIFLI